MALQSLPAAHANVILTYTGNDFTNFNSPYTGSDRVTVTITLANPLGDNLNLSPVTPLGFSLSDGVQTLTQATPNLTTKIFEFSTSPSGQITLWNVQVATTGGGAGIFTINNGFILPQDFGEQSQASQSIIGSCPNPTIALIGKIGMDLCDPAGWTSTLSSAPEPSTAAVLGSALLGLGLFWWRRRRKLDLAQ